MDVGVIREEAFFMRMEEVGPMVDGGLLRGSTSEDFGTPCISIKAVRECQNIEYPNSQMTIKMDDANRAICPDNTSQQRKSDCVVTTKGDYSWQGRAGFRWPLLVGISCRRAHQDTIMSFLNLLNTVCVVVAIPDQHRRPEQGVRRRTK